MLYSIPRIGLYTIQVFYRLQAAKAQINVPIPL
jgi:hypothetical protein